MKIHKSKIDWWMGLLLIYPIFRSIQAIIEGDWIGYVVLIGVLLLIIFVSKTTRYIIRENQLIVKSMWIVNKKIDVSHIRRIEKSNSLLSSPALSLDRIAVKYNKYDEVYLSPQNKQLFAEELRAINPEIEVAL